MRGLFYKDFCGIFMTKNMIVRILILFVCLSPLALNGVMAGSSFLVLGAWVWVTIAVNTVFTDMMDHGLVFLFTLPFSRRQYALEKFLLACLPVVVFCGIFLMWGVLGGKEIEEVLLCVTLSWILSTFIASIEIPGYLYFGIDKAQFVSVIIMLVTAGFMGLLLTAGVDPTNLVISLSSTQIFGIFFAAGCAAIGLGLFATNLILKKRDL